MPIEELTRHGALRGYSAFDVEKVIEDYMSLDVLIRDGELVKFLD